MKVNYQSEQPITDAACKHSTGKTLHQWFAVLDQHNSAQQKRRDAIQWLYEQANKDAWWSTTIWVEYERANGIVQKDGKIEGYNICVTKTIQAPLKDVYRGLSNSSEWNKWFGDNVSAKIAENETFSDKSGNKGEFLRVRQDKDLRFTWQGAQSDAATQVDIALASKGENKTGLTLTHNRIQQRAEADGLRLAWSESLDRLKALVEP